MKIEASKRLAQQEQVSAATDTKGAIKFLKSEFQEFGIDVKKIYETDPGALAIVLKAPVGPVTLGLVLANDGSVQFEIIHAEGVNPVVPDFDTLDSFSAELKRGKGSAKALTVPLRKMEKQAKAVEEFTYVLGTCTRWMLTLQECLAGIEAQMDRKKRKA